MRAESDEKTCNVRWINFDIICENLVSNIDNEFYNVIFEKLKHSVNRDWQNIQKSDDNFR
jgi:hypothetical protein